MQRLGRRHVLCKGGGGRQQACVQLLILRRESVCFEQRADHLRQGAHGETGEHAVCPHKQVYEIDERPCRHLEQLRI